MKKVLAAILCALLIAGCQHANEMPIEKQFIPEIKVQPALPTIGEHWLSLLEQNDEMVGWISVPGTSIDYPVMQAADNSKYLYRGFDEQYSRFGTPFLDYRCCIQPPCRNFVLYGHATAGGNLFGQLEAYTDQEYAAQNKNIVFNTIYTDATYTVFAVLKTPVSGADVFDYTCCDFESDADWLAFLQEAQRRSLVQLDVAVSVSDRILTIQTCTYDSVGTRLVVMARRNA